jgi:DNA-binding transcriptional LysR family regulator
LRVAGPFDFTRDLTPILAAFLTAHPAVRLELRLSNRTLDMVDDVSNAIHDPTAAHAQRPSVDRARIDLLAILAHHFWLGPLAVLET